MTQKTQHLPYEEIAPGTYRIDEYQGANCYLLLGDDAALLIDTGNGLFDLRGTVESLTGLPVTVVATHGHADHTGGRDQFPVLHLHRADTAFIYRIAQARFITKGLLKAGPQYAEQGITKKDLTKGPYKPNIVPIEDGHVFSLGGRDVRVVHTPGHSRGSIVLLDDLHSLMFTGDNANPGVWLWVPGAISVKDWLPGYEKTLELARRYTPWCGHGPGLLTLEQMEQLKDCAYALLKTQRKNTFWPKIRIYPSKEAAMQEDGISIWYRTSRIF